jgi:transcription antitermination factor NusG
MSWYILIVRQGFEVFVRNQLISRQKELPLEEVVISQDLSGYVLIRSTEITSQNAGSFLIYDGVLKFLGTKSQPQKFTNRQIKKISFSVSEEVVSPVKSKFKLGDCVIVKQGDLADISGEIVELGRRIVKIKPAILRKIVKVRIRDIDFL